MLDLEIMAIYQTVILSLFSGIAGVVVGCILTAALTYRFQKKLLDLQLAAQAKQHLEVLDFQLKQGEQDALQRAASSQKQVEVMETLRHVLRDLTTHIAGVEGQLRKN